MKTVSDLIERRPPANLDAEKGVIGSVLLLSDMLDDVAMVVRPNDFYDDANQKIYQHLLSMHDEGRQVDDITLLVERLKNAGDYDLIGGAAYLYEIGESVPTAAHAMYYAQIVKDKSMARSLIQTSTDILRDAYDQSIPSREMLSRAEEKIFAILEKKGIGDMQSVRDVMIESLDRINARMDEHHDIGGVATGIRGLDSLLGGLHKSELIILAARPSMGKTALALNIAEHASINENVTTLVVSLEMASVELGDRLLCSSAKVNGQRLRDGTISQEDRRKLVERAAVISNAPLFIDDSPSRTMTEIGATARRLKRKDNLGLIVIDYMQLIEPDNSSDPRQEQVAKIARRLKRLARELEVPVLCLAQLNRQAEVSKDNRPRLSHLRESGAIEQDADVVMFIHREEYYLTSEEEKEQVKGQAEIIVSKQRNGPIGDVKVTWLHKYTRFEDAAPDRYQEFDEFNAFGEEF